MAEAVSSGIEYIDGLESIGTPNGERAAVVSGGLGFDKIVTLLLPVKAQQEGGDNVPYAYIVAPTEA